MSVLTRIRGLARLLWLSGARLRCPNCGEGAMFSSLFEMHATCDVCGVRYERRDGESIGGMAITLVFAPSLALAGFFVVDLTTRVPFWWNMWGWLAVLVLLCTLMYRHSRAAWVAVSYLTGGVYADAPEPDTSAERQQLVDAVRSTRPESSNHASGE